METLLKWFRPAAHLPEIEDQAKVNHLYKYWRFRMMYSMLIGYAFYYYTRKSFTIAMPALMLDLGYDKLQLSILTTIFAVTYGLSKFTSGVMSDRSNPRIFMAIGLILTGVCNIFFGLSSMISVFAMCWGLNGFFQGFGAPPCAHFMTQWYSRSERGSWWSIWNLSHNVGSLTIPFIILFCIHNWDWRMGMYVPGTICIFGGLFLLNRLRESPQSIGLPSVEKFRNDFVVKKDEDKDAHSLTANQLFVKYVLKNKLIWLLAFANFFVYIVRQALSDWTAIYMMESHDYSQLKAQSVIWWLEIGGVAGSLLSGMASDRLFAARRGPICVIFAIGICSAVLLFWQVSGTYLYLDYAAVILLGLFIYGPQMLIGLASAELTHKEAAATSNGFVGACGYIGAACAGWPLMKITQLFSWNGFFMALACCAGIVALLLLPTWNASKAKLMSAKTPTPS